MKICDEVYNLCKFHLKSTPWFQSNSTQFFQRRNLVRVGTKIQTDIPASILQFETTKTQPINILVLFPAAHCVVFPQRIFSGVFAPYGLVFLQKIVQLQGAYFCECIESGIIKALSFILYQGCNSLCYVGFRVCYL